MGEALNSFRGLFESSRMPGLLGRMFAYQLVMALAYAHEKGVIHTDIKPNTIFVRMRTHSKIESGYLKVPAPEQDRNEEYHTPIPSYGLQRFYFDIDHFQTMNEFEITLGDWGVSSWRNKHLCKLMQPVFLRSPEVLIGAPWDKETDLWNLGAVIHEFYRAMRLFTGRTPPDERYTLREHLGEIVNFFGPFPKEFLEKGDQKIVAEHFNEDGSLRETAGEWLTEFDSEGICPGISDPEMKKYYISSLRSLMMINPKDRAGYRDLIYHPWITGGVIYESSDSEDESDDELDEEANEKTTEKKDDKSDENAEKVGEEINGVARSDDEARSS